MASATDLDGPGRAATDCLLVHGPARECGSGDACELSFLPHLDETAGSLNGDASSHARTGGGAVHLPIGEDAQVGGRRLRPGISAIGEDRAVQEGEIGVVRVLEWDRSPGGGGDCRGSIDQLQRR